MDIIAVSERFLEGKIGMDISKEKWIQEFAQIKEQYAKLIAKGNQFIEEKVYKGWKVGQYVELKDEIRFFVYRNFPELYSKYFQDEPQLPVVSKWYYFLTRVFWISEKRINRYLWPKYGEQVAGYINYYNKKLEKVINEIEEQI